MLPVATHFNMVMGMDIHINLILGVPAPVPHLYFGMIMDVFDYIPKIGQTVEVNKRKVAQPMTEAVFIQFPMAGPFAKWPFMKGEAFLGSATVGSISLTVGQMLQSMAALAVGVVSEDLGKAIAPDLPEPTSVYPFTRFFEPVLSCSDIGIPAPMSPDKKGGVKGLAFLGGLVLGGPCGPLVTAGGFPRPAPLSAFAMRIAMKFAMKAVAKVAAKAIKLVNKGLKKLFGKNNRCSKWLCSKGFDPVDIASGKVLAAREDFMLPGPIPLIWERNYYSDSDYESTVGQRWSHTYDMYIQLDVLQDIQEDIKQDIPVVKLRMSDGRLTGFRRIEIGETEYDRQEKLELTRDEEGYLLKDADRLYYRFHEGEEGKRWYIRSIQDTSGNSIQFQYDEQNALQKIIDSVGRELSIDTDAYNKILAIHAPHPTTKGKTFPIARYEYDKAGDLIKSTNALDHSYHYKYNNHLMVQRTRPDGVSFYYQYDSEENNARCIHTYGDGGLYKGNLHYEKGKTTIERIVAHPDGHTDTYTEIYYHDGAVVHRKIDALGNETKYEYNDFYELQTEIDPLGNKTTYQYDDRGNLTQTTYPDKTKIQMTYSADNLLEQATDQVGGKWKWEYDDKGRLIRRTDCMDRATKYKYDDKGLLTQFTDPMGGRTLIGYNKNKEPDQLTLPNNASTRWRYDRLGRSKATIDPKGNTQRRTFDLLGQVTKVQQPDGNILKLKYSVRGNIIHAKDKQRDIRFEYGGVNDLIAHIENDTKVEFKYDTDSRLVAIVNEHGSVYKFDLNANGEVELESGFDEIKRHYKRDANGKVTKVSRASGIESFYQYDPMSRITQRLHSTGEIEQYSYREDGELIRAVNDDADVVFEKDLIGNTITEIQNGYKVHSEYDAMGLRTRLNTSLGLDLAISRDIMGDVSGMRTQGKTPSWEIQLKRDIMGLELERLLPGGVKGKWDRDQLGRPVHHHIFGGDGKAQRSRTYEWDVNYRLKRFIDFGKDITQFQHDKVGNLSAAIYPDGKSQHRNPDATGNLFRKTDRSDRKYGPAGQLLEAEGTRYDYDAEGNLIKKTTAEGEVWHYKWNAAGMLEKVIRPDKKEVTFAYDALGRRTAKTYDGNTTRWIWDVNVPIHEWQTPTTDTTKNTIFTNEPDTDLIIQDDDDDEIIFIEKNPMAYGNTEDTDVITIEEITTTSKTVQIASQPIVVQTPVPVDMVTWLFEPESFKPIAKITNDKRYSIQTDHIGTPISMYDNEGKRTWVCDLNTYGKASLSQGGTKGCPFRYQGQYVDEETGLYYNRFRYYYIKEGIYISQDPIGIDGGTLNVYSYVKDSNFRIDPLGLYDPFDFQFTQESIGKTFNQGKWEGRSVEEAIQEAKRTGKLPEGLELKFERIMTGQGEVWATLNNRTLYVAQQANLTNINAVDMNGKGINQFNKLVSAEGGGIQERGVSPEVRC